MPVTIPHIDLDALGERDAGGSNAFLARLIANNLRLNSLRTNAVLLGGEWEQIDAAVIETAAAVFSGITDLEAARLRQPLGDLGVLSSVYQTIGGMTVASVNMAIEVDDEEDRISSSYVGVPVPVTSKSFRIDLRELVRGRRDGARIDTANIAAATRVVVEELERMLFLGSVIVQRGNSIYGYLNHPQRNVVAGGADWGTAANIVPNVLAMLGALRADRQYGPYKLYLNDVQYMEALVFSGTTTTPIMSIIEQFPGMGPGSVKSHPNVPAGQAVMVSMTRSTVDVATAQEILPVEWQAKGGLVFHCKVLAVKVPRVKADASGQSGVAHLSGI
jgi:uncharacterized linocin/CFP29 family protein